MQTPRPSHRPPLASGVRIGLAAALVVLLPPEPARAQVATELIRDGSIGLDASFQPAEIVPGVFEIGEDLGDRPGAGPNLFHSFLRFNVGTGDTALFTADLPTDNVITRVTGPNSPSQIYGTIASSIPGADLYLVNPSGILFGPSGGLDIQGSFHATSADYLELSGPLERFYAELDQPSTLSSAPVTAYGFLGPSAAPIQVTESILSVPVGETLRFVGGPIEISGGVSGFLDAPGGEIDLVAVASAGEVRFDSPPDLSSFEVLAPVTLSDLALLNVGATGLDAGEIQIRGSDVLIDGSVLAAGDGSFLSGPGDGSEHGGLIDVRASESVAVLGGSQLTTDAAGSGAVLVRAPDFRMQGSTLSSLSLGALDAPDRGIDVRSSGDITIAGGSTVRAGSFGAGRGGSLFFRSGLDFTLGNPSNPGTSEILSVAFGSGAAGAIDVIAGGDAQLGLGVLVGFAGDTGVAPDVNLTAGSLVLRGALGIESRIASESVGLAHAGDVQVTIGGDLRILGGEIASTSGGAGRAGSVGVLVGGDLLLGGSERLAPGFSSARIRAESSGFGFDGTSLIGTGPVTVAVGGSLVSDAGWIRTVSTGGGDAGAVRVSAGGDLLALGDLETIGDSVQETAQISAFASGGGSAGDVSAVADGDLALVLTVVASDASGGRSGDITLASGGDLTSFFSVITSTESDGARSGAVLIDAAGDLTLLDSGVATGDLATGEGSAPIHLRAGGGVELSATSLLTGSVGDVSGDIFIEGTDVAILEGSILSTPNLSPTQGGDITILGSESVTICGGSADRCSSGSVTQIATGLVEGTAAASGDIRIETDALRIEKALLTTLSGEGESGSITATVRTFESRGDTIFSAGTSGSRDGGEVRIEASESALLSRTLVSTSTTGQGDAGDITIVSPRVVLDGEEPGSTILATITSGAGDAGDVLIEADELVLRNGASVFTASTTPMEGDAGLVQGDAGDVILNVTGTVEISGGTDSEIGTAILATTETEGDAGDVVVRADRLVIDGNGELGAAGITTFTNGSGSGGDITIDVATLSVAEGGAVISGTGFESSVAPGGTSAGDIRITASESVELVGEDFLVGTQIQASTTSGVDAGNITIETPELKIRNGLIQAGSGAVPLDGDGPPPDVSDFPFGDAGDIEITVDRFSMTGAGFVSTSALGAGASGSITVTATEFLEIDGRRSAGLPTGEGPLGASINNATVGTGDAGDVTVSAPVMLIRGESSGIGAETAFAGSGGSVRVSGDTLEMTDGAGILASTSSTGDGGTVEVDFRESIALASGASVSSASIVAASVTPLPEITGDAGSVRVETGRLTLTSEASITALTETRGAAGQVEIAVDTLEMQDGARIESSSLRTTEELGGNEPGAAGSLAIDARRVEVVDSRITTFAAEGPPVISDENPDDTEARREGNISIDARERLVLDGGTITASVAEGLGGSIDVRGSDIVLRDGSAILAKAIPTDLPAQGGRITITADVFLQSPDSEVSADAGSGIDGIVSINSPEIDLESGLVALPVAFLDATTLLRPTCEARAADPSREGSFTVARRGGLPATPEGFLVAFEADRPAASGMARAPSQPSEAFRSGRFETAARGWRDAADSGDDAAQRRALLGLAQSQQALGEYRASVETLEKLRGLAEASGEQADLAAALGSLGQAYLELGQPDVASQYFQRGIELAESSGRSDQAAGMLNNRANLLTSERAFADALASYERAAELARQADDPLRESQALANAAHTALQAEDALEAARLLERATGLTRRLPETRAAAFVRIHLARSDARLATRSADQRRSSLLRAHAGLLRARETATRLQDERSLSYALGNLGTLYQSEQRIDEALTLTRAALKAAERAYAPESTYRWQWQQGQLLWARGDTEAALDSYRRAVELLEQTRRESRTGSGEGEIYFRRQVAPVYRDLVDALFQTADAGDAARARPLLLEARTTMEKLKAAELRDYFRDECVAALEARTTRPEDVPGRAAVVYPVLLRDRVEILVHLPSGLERFSVPSEGGVVRRDARELRQAVQARASEGYLRSSQQLYDTLVRPYAERLEAEKVDTLVFIPDAALRMLPLGALHDGTHYLVERYAVAVTPGLSLVDPKPLDREGARVLLGGLSEAVGGFPPLAKVPKELETIQSIFGGEVLLDASFRTERLQEEVATGGPSIVHLASHAVFTGDPDESFLLTHDGRLTLDRMAEVVGQTRFRERSLELLVLSACETAAGDDRAGLGLAGVAVRSGARSVLGSLWSISDEATYELIVAFYRALKQPGVSRAAALQRAQQQLIASEDFDHPFYWSPFLMISNWL